MVAAQDPEAQSLAQAPTAKGVRQPGDLVIELREGELPALVGDRWVVAVAKRRDTRRCPERPVVSHRAEDPEHPSRRFEPEGSGPQQGGNRPGLDRGPITVIAECRRGAQSER